jgi:hypothetical protein
MRVIHAKSALLACFDMDPLCNGIKRPKVAPILGNKLLDAQALLRLS